MIAVGALDAALAGSPRTLRLERSLPTRVRLGESVASTLYLTNTGRRRVHGVVRDGWQPSAGAHPTRARLDVPPQERRAVATTLTPFRRGERRAAQVTVRSFGPLGLAARQATHRPAGRHPGAAAVRVPQASALPAGQAAGARRPGERA